MKVWFRSFGLDQGGNDRIISLLRGSGIDPTSVDSETPHGPGIVFCEEPTDAPCELLHALSNDGRGRLLVLTLTPLKSSSVWKLLDAGASDVLNLDGSKDVAGKITQRFKRWQAIDELVSSPLVRENLVGRSRLWLSILRRIVEVGRFTSSSVLITGESGTGKELVARLVHSLDPRPAKRDLVVLDCTTIVPELSGSEFFGHERGAFTGAYAARDGAFAMANGGTLFLDEVGELPMQLQTQLLRVIQERSFKRVGGNNWYQTDFRLICATNRDLQKAVKEGQFRSDLYFRIAAWKCELPPLKQRTGDIIPLTEYFIRQLACDGDSPVLDPPVREYLLNRSYPGNVRELKQIVTGIMSRYVGPGPITVGDIPEEDLPKGKFDAPPWHDGDFEGIIRKALFCGIDLKEIGRSAEDAAIRIAVDEENGSLQRAAKKLGVTDRTLQIRRASDRDRERPLSDDGNGGPPPI